jgi:hypothetical protein
MASEVFDEPHNDLDIRRLFQEIEHNIKVMNREKISEITGNVSKEDFNDVARTAARLRARYLEKVIQLESTEDISSSDISTLRETRLMYEEVHKGFAALQHALHRGYFSLAE